MADHLGIKICNYVCSFVFSDPDLFTKKVQAGLPGFLFRSRGFAHYFYWLLLLEFLWDTPSKSISITLVKAKNKLPCEQWFLQAGRYVRPRETTARRVA